MSGRTSRQDPLKSFNFIVEIDGFKRLGFQSVTGGQANTGTVEYREGGANASVQKSPGLTNYDNITLRRGVIVDPAGEGEDDFYNWYLQIQSIRTAGNADPDHRRGMTIVLINRDGTEGQRWRYFNCWPSRYMPFSDLSGQDENDVMEELEIVTEGFDREGSTAPPGVGGSLAPVFGTGNG